MHIVGLCVANTVVCPVRWAVHIVYVCVCVCVANTVVCPVRWCSAYSMCVCVCVCS